jgi:hypothetical protein
MTDFNEIWRGRYISRGHHKVIRLTIFIISQGLLSFMFRVCIHPGHCADDHIIQFIGATILTVVSVNVYVCMYMYSNVCLWHHGLRRYIIFEYSLGLRCWNFFTVKCFFYSGIFHTGTCIRNLFLIL